MTITQPDQVTLVENQGWDERVLVCACGDLVQTCIVVTQRYVVLIDTLLNPQTATALLAIARTHLVAGRQLLAVDTHADWDHAWGNQIFAGPEAAHPAPIIGSRTCSERLRSLESQRRLDAMRDQEPERFNGVRLTPPTLLFEERMGIDGGDLTLELFATPGHQPDHIAVFIPEISTLIAGDAAELPFPLVDDAAGIPLLRDSLARMAALNPSTALYCHAPVTSGPKLLQTNIAYFDALEKQCRDALARGVPAHPPEDVDIEALIAYPLAAAVPPEVDAATLPDLYRKGHRSAIKAMLAYLGAKPLS